MASTATPYIIQCITRCSLCLRMMIVLIFLSSRHTAPCYQDAADPIHPQVGPNPLLSDAFSGTNSIHKCLAISSFPTTLGSFQRLVEVENLEGRGGEVGRMYVDISGSFLQLRRWVLCTLKRHVSHQRELNTAFVTSFLVANLGFRLGWVNICKFVFLGSSWRKHTEWPIFFFSFCTSWCCTWLKQITESSVEI